ncbi:MAG: hypothetical protein NT001_01610, partial [Candidatus Woesearchaeota archaeon]|nr:hypothetical protein [Candidatus Woesearchaeota archaeon]
MIFNSPSALSKLNLFHYLDGQVNDSDGKMITGAAVLGYDVNNNLKFLTNTTAGGIIPQQNVIDYQETASGRTHYNNYTINVSYLAGANVSGKFNISTNMNISIEINSTLFLLFINQTNPTGQIINETNPIQPGQNLTIRVNATEVGESISSVWIIIWQTVASAGNILWQGLMSLIGGLWQVQVPVNVSYPAHINYTVFANDSTNKTVQIQGNFTTTPCTECIVNSSGGDFTELTDCMDYINNTNSSCVLNEANKAYDILNDVSYNITKEDLFSVIRIINTNITLNCNNSMIQGINAGVGVSVEADNSTVENCSFRNFAFGISVSGNFTNITGNTFEYIGNYSILFYDSLNNNNIWLNNFYDKGIGIDKSKVISIDSTNHSDYGLGFPVTYEFSIPSGSSNLKAYRRYLASEPWAQIAEKTSSDIFNGIEAVRFDYAHDIAFVSVAFNNSSDNIYVEITDSSGITQSISYLGASK